MECPAARGERNGVFRLLSLERIFCDERCAEALSDDALLAAMTSFEAALAKACARAGLVPAADARLIVEVCERARFETRVLAREARQAGTLAIPFVRHLTSLVAVASSSAARYVHYGATSQDVIDSAAALCLKAAAERNGALLRRLGDAAAALAERHAGTPTVARTLLQPALPVPFGWKAAVWLSLVARAYVRYRSAAEQACTLQLGGAAGTLSAFGSQGDAIATALGAELGLPRAPVTWHSARDGFARLGAETAILAGASAKIARDVSLLMQAEVAEAAEPAAAGRGGSTSLPHKRNPSLCLLALEAAQRAPALAATLLGELAPEHERGLGQWQSQWFTLRELSLAASSGVAAMGEALEGLQIDPAAMLANLERTRGLVFSEALALKVGRELAEELCERAVAHGKTLIEVVREEPRTGLPEAELSALFDPQQRYGAAAAMIERSLAMWRGIRP